jgi:lysophospholipase L1-like esterase
LINSALFVASTILMGAVLELGVRIFMPQDPRFHDHRSIRRVSPVSPDFWENIPDSRNDFYWGVPVHINHYGLRGEDIAVPKAAHTFRILGVGDSVMFGSGVRIEDTLLKVLEVHLNGAAPNGTKYETLNAGVASVGLDYYYHFIRTNAPILEPDLVLVGVCLNDIAFYPDSGPRPKLYDPSRTGRLVRAFSDFLLKYSHLYIAGYTKLKSILYSAGILDITKRQGYNFLPLEPPSARQTEAWDTSFQLLSRIVDLCRQRNWRLVVVIFPMEVQACPASLKLYRDRLRVRVGDEVLAGEPQRRISGFGAAHGVTVIDLLPAFRSKSASNLYLRNIMISLDPIHFSPLGHRIAGEEIFRVLNANRIVALRERIVGFSEAN